MSPRLGVWTAAVFAAVFAGFQVRCAVVPIARFEWIGAIDYDEAFQAEQFLLAAGDPTPALNDNPVVHGSEYLWLAYAYRPFVKAGRALSPLGAYRALKVFHILAAAASLIMLALLLQAFAVDGRAIPLTVAVAGTNPLFFNAAPLLKADANVALACLLGGWLCLLAYDRQPRPAAMAGAMALAGLGAAVKWWGLFLTVPAVHLAMRHGGAGLPRWSVLVSGAFAAFSAAAAYAAQRGYLVDLAPALAARLPGAGAAAAAISLAAAGGAAAALKFPPRAYVPLAVLTLFAAAVCAFAAPVILGPWLAHSVHYFSKFLVVGPGHGAGPAWWENLAAWIGAMFQYQFIPWAWLIMAPAAVLALRGGALNVRRQPWNALALFFAAHLAFLVLLLSRRNPPTLAMLFPFLAAVVVIPVFSSASAFGEKARRVFLGLLVLQTLHFAGLWPGLLRRYASAPFQAQALENWIAETLPEGAALHSPTRRVVASGVVNTPYSEWGGVAALERLAAQGPSSDAEFWLFQRPASGLFEGRLSALRTAGRLVPWGTEKDIPGYARGVRVEKRYGLFLAPALTKPRGAATLPAVEKTR